MTGYIILAVLIAICAIIIFLGKSEDKVLKISARILMVLGFIGLCFLWACTKNDLPSTKTYTIILTILFLISEIIFSVSTKKPVDGCITFLSITSMAFVLSGSPSYSINPIDDKHGYIYVPLTSWFTGISHGKGTVIIDTTIISQRGSTDNTPREYHLVGIRNNEGHIIIPKVCKSEDGYKDFEIVEFAQEESSKYINAIRLVKPDGTTEKLDPYGDDVADKDYKIPWFDDDTFEMGNT